MIQTQNVDRRRGVLTALNLALGIAVVASPVAAADKPEAELPLKRIVLFNSGVGFFEHGAQIEGNQDVELKFNVEDVNDLLKSLVLQDLGGGTVSTVTYGSKDPIDRTLRTFAIDLTTNPTLADLLRQVRGERVEVEAPDKIAGTILGVETRRQQVGKDEAIDVDYLNLVTDQGLRSLALKDVGRIKLANESLDNELRQALAVLAAAHATDKKTVTLSFLGEGKRPVSVGYILETPVWKTSYRLVLRDKESALLQGWAIVENTTEEDWKDVSLDLVSGRPISFVMDLYEPLYAERPVVETELFASLRPQTYDQDLAGKEEEFLARRRKDGGLRDEKRAEPSSPPVAAKAVPSSSAPLAEGQVASGGGGFRGVYSVAPAAQGGEMGELFRYAIKEPVSLARQKSAMLPIVNENVETEKVSIYNPQVHAKHPLNGLRLKNSTDLHLMQGPITVFDDSAYAGDARIEDLSPGSERLISYAMNLGIEVATEAKPHPDELASVKIVKGVLEAARKFRRQTHYTIKNSGDETAQVLVEYPLDAQWTLVAPAEPFEKTRDMYRFAVAAEPGQTATLDVIEESTQTQTVGVTSLNDDMVHIFLSSPVVDPKVKEALRTIQGRKLKLAETSARLQQAQQSIAAISTEQTRIRENMKTVDNTSEIYRRYVKKFGDQEDEVERLNTEIASLTEEVRRMQTELDQFLASLEVG